MALDRSPTPEAPSFKYDLLDIQDIGVSFTHPTSPGSLSIPATFYGTSEGRVRVDSRSWNRRSSLVASICDMTMEADQLHSALIDNDTTNLKKIIHLHHSKFHLNLHETLLDKSSVESRSRRISQDVEILLTKSQTLLDQWGSRTSFEGSEASEVPIVFRNALHIAVFHNSLDAVKLLLKYGIDPCQPWVNLHPGLYHRRRSTADFTSTLLSQNSDTISTTQNLSFDEQRDGPFIRVHADQTDPQYCALPPLFDDNSASQQTHAALNSLSERLHDIAESSREDNFDLIGYYTTEELFSLPPLFLAVAEGRIKSLHLLLRFGAVPNIRDKNGYSPLCLATKSEYFNINCVSLLIANGGQIHLKNNVGESAFTLYPEVELIQKALLSTALSCKHDSNKQEDGRRSASVGPDSIRSGSITRFFKRLSTSSSTDRGHKKSSKRTSSPEKDQLKISRNLSIDSDPEKIILDVIAGNEDLNINIGDMRKLSTCDSIGSVLSKHLSNLQVKTNDPISVSL